MHATRLKLQILADHSKPRIAEYFAGKGAAYTRRYYPLWERPGSWRIFLDEKVHSGDIIGVHCVWSSFE